MSLPLPNLDDRRFEDLVEELRTHIPGYAPGWTDHNPSDPGITFMEMLAWLAEMLLFRLNRIPPGIYKKFLLLIKETGDTPAKAVENLWKPYRVITQPDFETLAIEANPAEVSRARCLENRNLEHTTGNETGHVSIVIVPKTTSIEEKPVLREELINEIQNYLFTRRLITTRVHIVAPGYLDVAIRFKLAAKANVDKDLLDTKVKKRLRSFLHPISGGAPGNGWPFGRDIVIPEVYRLIEETQGVDYTIDAALIPSAQFVELFFDGIVFEESLPQNSYAIKNNGETCFPIVEARGEEKVDRLVVNGFKQGDHVVLTHKDDSYNYRVLEVKSVSAANWKELEVEPFRVDEDFPAGSITAAEDGKIRTTITQPILAGREVHKLEIDGFAEEDIVDVVEKKADNTEVIVARNIELKAVERCTDRVFLEENWLPWFIEHRAWGRAQGAIIL
jgi:hypothetical protein